MRTTVTTAIVPTTIATAGQPDMRDIRVTAPA
jgi:hypothetical protein